MSEYPGLEPTTAYVDADADGYQESAVLDTDGDGHADTVLTDVDGDGYADVAAFDNAPDGEFVADVVAIDVDGDGYADVVADDTDFDGVFDTETHDPGVPLEQANPYGSGVVGETAAATGDSGGSGGSGGSDTGGSVIAGEGGDALFVDPDGGVSFSGSNAAGDTFSFDTT